MDAAQGFIQRRMGEGQPFVAAHVRPYPDGCIAIWTMLGEGNTVGYSYCSGAMCELSEYWLGWSH